MKLRMQFVLLPLLLSMALSGCASLVENKPYISDSYTALSSSLNPSNSALIFGSFWQTKEKKKCAYLFGQYTFLQINPQAGNFAFAPGIVYSSARDQFLFYTPPVPVGSSLRLIHFFANCGNINYSIDRGLQGRSAIDVKVTEPGLHWAGSLAYCRKDYSVTQKDSYSLEGCDFYPYGPNTELEDLREIQQHFKNTPWEPIIEKRIEELSK